LKAGELGIGKPEVVVGHVKLPSFGSLNHISTGMGIPFMGPEPRESTAPGNRITVMHNELRAT
jgi:hypothetical protein